MARLTSLIDTTTSAGIDIGGRDGPVARPGTAQLRYAAPAMSDVPAAGTKESAPDRQTSVWVPGTQLADTVRDWAPVEYVTADRVFERLADPIGWLDQVAEVLTDEGYLCLAVADKRFTAQARRPVSSTGQLLDANLRGLTRPTTQQVFDDAALRLREPNVVALWNGRDPRAFERIGDDPASAAYQLSLNQQDSGGDITVQAHVFTDQSFVDLLTDLAEMGLLDFAVAEFMPTKRFDVEFFVTLQKLPSWLTAEARRRRQEAGFALCRERLARADRVLVGGRDEPPMLPSMPAVAAYVRTEGSRVAHDVAVRARQARDQAAAFRARRKR